VHVCAVCACAMCACVHARVSCVRVSRVRVCMCACVTCARVHVYVRVCAVCMMHVGHVCTHVRARMCMCVSPTQSVCHVYGTYVESARVSVCEVFRPIWHVLFNCNAGCARVSAHAPKACTGDWRLRDAVRSAEGHFLACRAADAYMCAGTGWRGCIANQVQVWAKGGHKLH